MNKLLIALFVTLGLVPFAGAAEFGTMDEAKALSEAAASYVTEVGAEQAAKDFMAPGSKWIDRDLYVTMLSMSDGLMLANGGKPALAGKNLVDVKDPSGKAMGREMISLKAPAWVDYQWQNPTTQAIQDKTSYCIPSETVVVCVGMYK